VNKKNEILVYNFNNTLSYLRNFETDYPVKEVIKLCQILINMKIFKLVYPVVLDFLDHTYQYRYRYIKSKLVNQLKGILSILDQNLDHRDFIYIYMKLKNVGF